MMGPLRSGSTQTSYRTVDAEPFHFSVLHLHLDLHLDQRRGCVSLIRSVDLAMSQLAVAGYSERCSSSKGDHDYD